MNIYIAFVQPEEDEDILPGDLKKAVIVAHSESEVRSFFEDWNICLTIDQIGWATDSILSTGVLMSNLVKPETIH